MVLRPLWKSLRVVEHLGTGALIALYLSLLTSVGHRPTWVPKVVRWWHGRLCRALGIRLSIQGHLEPGCLLVGNHVSWLDIPVLGAQGEIGFLSKSEVRGWPLIGWMAELAGTSFIERGAHQAERISAHLAEEVARGRSLMVFPEGTTTDGKQVRRFHPRLFVIAQAPGLQIQPVAIGYRRGSDPAPDPVVPFVGEDTLIANLWRVVHHPDLVAHIRFLSPIRPAEGQTRRALAEQAHSAILEGLGLNRRTDTGPVLEPSEEGPPEGAEAGPTSLDPRPA